MVFCGWRKFILNNQYDVYGQVPVGFGKNPAIIVVDFQLAFTDPVFEMGGAHLIDQAVKNTAKLLEVGRKALVPIAKCVMGYRGIDEQPYWKVAACKNLIIGSPQCQIDPRIDDPLYDVNFVKSGPSIFFQTPLTTFLVAKRVDTVIVTGCVTSGCVRASVVDSFQYGFRTLVPENCVGDHAEKPHTDSLRDISRRYADILSLDETIRLIENWGKSNNV